jgi:uncharacterized protein (UPF0276 family)
VSNDARSRISSTRPGIGLRGPHVDEILAHRPDIAWLEVHSENYLGNWAACASLERIREHYPLSFHGVSLSLGSDAPLDQQHLRRLRSLIDRMEPFLVSEHLAWSRASGSHLNDLLPLPYTDSSREFVPPTNRFVPVRLSSPGSSYSMCCLQQPA